MADGKVMQKYYPPDFDPEDLRKHKDVLRAAGRGRGGKRRRGGKMMEMRMMFPFSLQCENCRDFVLVGTKFNSKVERIRGEDYLGIALWRFYGRCPHCRNPITFRTDPKNTDYVLETGGVRTGDANRDIKLAEEAIEKAKEEEAAGDAAKALELKSYSTTEELKTLEALDELRRINRRLMGRPDKLSDFVLKKLQQDAEGREATMDEEEMRWARLMFDKRDRDSDNASSASNCSSEEEEIALPKDSVNNGIDPRKPAKFFAVTEAKNGTNLSKGRNKGEDDLLNDVLDGLSCSSGESSNEKVLIKRARR